MFHLLLDELFLVAGIATAEQVRLELRRSAHLYFSLQLLQSHGVVLHLEHSGDTRDPRTLGFHVMQMPASRKVQLLQHLFSLTFAVHVAACHQPPQVVFELIGELDWYLATKGHPLVMRQITPPFGIKLLEEVLAVRSQRFCGENKQCKADVNWCRSYLSSVLASIKVMIQELCQACWEGIFFRPQQVCGLRSSHHSILDVELLLHHQHGRLRVPDLLDLLVTVVSEVPHILLLLQCSCL
mmetsp:Transcript_1873/g.4753  ORF Transcript_1873/g.4753 Transcript_1873/m.4753 type:complete len:240 (+) Transcript_1873:997-1716(+)